MGGTCSRQKPLKFIFQGLDAAGKTTLLYRLKLGEVVTTIPTIGFNVETIYSRGVELTGWDVGGRDKIRPLLRHYYPGTDGIIYVIDCADRERVDQALEEMNDLILKEPGLKDQHLVLMVLANKQDLDNCLGPSDIEDKIKERYSIPDHFSLFVIPSSAMNEGMNSVKAGFDKFTRFVMMKREGKLPGGLLYKAWQDNQEENKEEEDDCSDTLFEQIKHSIFKNPLSMLKSVLFY